LRRSHSPARASCFFLELFLGLVRFLLRVEELLDLFRVDAVERFQLVGCILGGLLRGLDLLLALHHFLQEFGLGVGHAGFLALFLFLRFRVGFGFRLRVCIGFCFCGCVCCGLLFGGHGVRLAFLPCLSGVLNGPVSRPGISAVD
jgi:hypothetical protein